MSHYEARLEHDLHGIRKDLDAIAAMVQEGLQDAVHALLAGNREHAYAVILGDLPINRAVRALDRACNAFVAVHLPSAGHLRWVSAVARINIALERIGDYAVTVCREAVQLPRAPDGILAREVELMAEESRRMLRLGMQAFAESNPDAARATMDTAEQVERTFDTVFEELVGDDSRWETRDLFELLVIFHMLERVSDQARNICEETVYAATGEGKKPKIYRILFLDESNAGMSKMAEAVARKDYPRHVAAYSAGRSAAETLDASMVEFLVQRGVDLNSDSPKTLEPIAGELSGYHVIIALKGEVTDYIERVPFHTAALKWDLGDPPGPGSADAEQRWEEVYRRIAVNLRDLVELLHGDEVT